MAAIIVALGLLTGPSRAWAQRPLGIDVSHWQGSITWSSVKGAGISFAWAKATEGNTNYYSDPNFAGNAGGAKAAGVPIGAYHYARYDLNSGTSGAAAEAGWFWQVAHNYIQGGGSYLMPMLDMEAATTGYTKTTLSQWANTWCQTVSNLAKASGVTIKPVIYTSSSFASSWFDSTVAARWTPWIAQWPTSPNPQTGAPSSTTPWSTWSVWQYSSTTTVPGISGNVDGDVFNGTSTSLATTLVIGGNGAPTITNPPSSITVAAGAPATFSVGASGTGTLSYQWLLNQTNISGATGTSYALANAQLTNAGGYAVTVSNTNGSTASSTVFLSVIAPLTNAAGCSLAPSGMVNWWPAEGNPNDIFGSNNATPHNGFSYVTGKQGQAFHFDGSTSYLGTGAASLPVPWTVCFWVNRQNAPGTGAALTGDGTYELKLEQYNGTRALGVTQFGVGDYSFGYIVPAGVWTHLALVGTSTGTALYVNGALQATLTNSLPLPRAYIGAGYVTSSAKFVDYMLGSLDEILTFNRALSGTEISAVYAAGSAGFVRVPQFTGAGPWGSGQFGLNLRGQTGKSFTVYASPNLVNWTRLGTVANPTGSVQFIDSTATNAQTLYRVSQP